MSCFATGHMPPVDTYLPPGSVAQLRGLSFPGSESEHEGGGKTAQLKIFYY